MFTTNTTLEIAQILDSGRTDKSLTYTHPFKYYTSIKIRRLKLYVSTWTIIKNKILRGKKASCIISCTK